MDPIHGPAARAVERRPRFLPFLGYALALLLLTAIALAVLWLNQSPWWGWALTLTLLVPIGVGARWWMRQRAGFQFGAWLLAALLVGGTAVLAYPPAQTRAAGDGDPKLTPQVSTQEGPVQGVTDDARTVEIFAGIPYARPPVGERRWRAPEPPAPREEVLVADRFSAVPVQGTSSFSTRALAQLVDVPLEGTLLNPYPVSEDSLTLNIWRSTAPAGDDLPVLVYIPGGGFSTGSGALPLYDGAALASRGDVITVTINYRLGVLGFLSHPDLAAESGYDASGNYGLLDQIAALEWVRENIAAFGGDAERVTITGESAGGQSVCILGATPLAEGLLDGIIAGSGACMGTTGDTENGDQFDTRDAAEDVGRRVSERLGDATIAEMRGMPVDRILEASRAFAAHWRPSIDGHVLPSSPAEIYASGQQHDVPILVGSNADEASLALAASSPIDVDEYRATATEAYGDLVDRFLSLYPGDTPKQALESSLQAQTDRVMTRAMHRWARLHTQSVDANAYLYFFSHTPPEEGLEKYGAYHGAEVAYAYDNLGVDSDADYTESDYRLRDQMSGYWMAFVSTGAPAAVALAPWPAVRTAPEQVMEFTADGSQVKPRPRADAIDFWMEYAGPIP
ncbi:carboxylesterase family protein [Microbacterium sp. zg.B48]|uniref:carboxylesterase/lipase family protein n=1 Tax=Microbacterium sp. zg.B48 TaxID=2969408 RepID=UPI00214BD3D4|nr:carboxylesterase family protein [Microbacterium sp. zg.B48]MCR2763370.1 carboxylesterase family protein [Microbacterium sp. zg.B48]